MTLYNSTVVCLVYTTYRQTHRCTSSPNGIKGLQPSRVDGPGYTIVVGDIEKLPFDMILIFWELISVILIFFDMI